MEHRDGSGARATAGRSPRLVWFRTFPTRDGAAAEESSLKALCRDNPRQVRRMILAFQDVVGELGLRLTAGVWGRGSRFRPGTPVSFPSLSRLFPR